MKITGDNYTWNVARSLWDLTMLDTTVFLYRLHMGRSTEEEVINCIWAELQERQLNLSEHISDSNVRVFPIDEGDFVFRIQINARPSKFSGRHYIQIKCGSDHKGECLFHIEEMSCDL